MMRGPRPYRWCAAHNDLMLRCQSLERTNALRTFINRKWYSLRFGVRALRNYRRMGLGIYEREFGFARFGISFYLFRYLLGLRWLRS